ncbi:anti-sigma factor antagonist [Zoogloeaceae bacteirum Par-f-2]|jgi:ABC-type transporter Mla MlaB component|uniref:STAS domain-containing protein n=1 Tax=Pseudothauera hydrothermalis TaxID=2184083 RepID=UPI000C7CDD7E|nr:STAS domain-containing protein [Pseudothauera hydrothermalis]AUL99019.1 anti-sigma B factor antagonist [Rhodocyclaceae bacterium]AVZ78242.1 anti-sigma factor antagonist [Zoogloeaceae bacteirum Par-f-2]
MSTCPPAVRRLAIVEDMTIYNAVAQKKTLVDALTDCDRLELDLSAVAEIDTAGFQLLVLIKREAARLGKQAHIVAHSQAVSQIVDFYNMAAEFGDPMLVPAQEAR